MSRNFIDPDAVKDREWKEKVREEWKEHYSGMRHSVISDWWMKKLDEYVEFFNAEPQNYKDYFMVDESGKSKLKT